MKCHIDLVVHGWVKNIVEANWFVVVIFSFGREVVHMPEDA